MREIKQVAAEPFVAFQTGATGNKICTRCGDGADQLKRVLKYALMLQKKVDRVFAIFQITSQNADILNLIPSWLCLVPKAWS
jgi:hypothetical protein